MRDVTALRSGEIWDQRILQLIEEADVFQLFWSWNALESEHVAREWQHALALRRPRFVRPVYWEDPLPAKPERNLPPAELTSLHFQKLPLLDAHATTPKSSPSAEVVASEPEQVRMADPPPPAPSPPSPRSRSPGEFTTIFAQRPPAQVPPPAASARFPTHDPGGVTEGSLDRLSTGSHNAPVPPDNPVGTSPPERSGPNEFTRVIAGARLPDGSQPSVFSQPMRKEAALPPQPAMQPQSKRPVIALVGLAIVVVVTVVFIVVLAVLL